MGAVPGLFGDWILGIQTAEPVLTLGPGASPCLGYCVWFGLSMCRTISHLREGTKSAASLNPPGEVSRGDVRRLVEA